jgi:K+-sensing histidine kinase KdpD
MNFQGIDHIDKLTSVDGRSFQALHSMLYNLAKNSFEADATKVDISCEEQDGQLVFIVLDNGRGLPMGLRKTFFTRDRVASTSLHDTFSTKHLTIPITTCLPCNSF